MYGQYTYVTKSGSHTLAFERGTISSVGNGARDARVIVVRKKGTTAKTSTAA